MCDPLSTALTMMKLHAFINVALDAGGNWAIDFPGYPGFTLNVVQKGECWLRTEDSENPIRLKAGDCFLLTGGKEFTLATDFRPKKRHRAEGMFTDARVAWRPAMAAETFSWQEPSSVSKVISRQSSFVVYQASSIRTAAPIRLLYCVGVRKDLLERCEEAAPDARSC